ncbi:hypothetical protein JCM10212_003321 [Sporobolomyces blumeae]
MESPSTAPTAEQEPRSGSDRVQGDAEEPLAAHEPEDAQRARPALPPSTSSASLSNPRRHAPAPLAFGAASTRRRVSPSAASNRDGHGPGPGGSASAGLAEPFPASRYLLTVVPPSHLPHDPPHPRTNPQCSGYGPPEHFRRGTLIPLYPTLSSQLAAIAREYGLPSTGGLVLYLLSTFDPSSSVPRPLAGSAGFAGDDGPRISEGAWNLLWARLFEDEHDVDEALTDEEIDAPPLPQMPLSFREEAQEYRSRQASDDPTVYSADDDLEQASSEVEDSTASSTKGKNVNRLASSGRSEIGRGPPPALTSPGGSRPSHRFSQSQQRYVSLPTPHSFRHSSRNSVRSVRSNFAHPYGSPAGKRSFSYGTVASSPLSAAASPGYGASVIVGKVEFDIDRSRAQGGKGKWYTAWLEGATTDAPQPTALASSSSRQELRLPRLVKTKFVPELQPFDSEFADQFTPPLSSEEGQADTTAESRARTTSEASRGMESATSAWSLAAMAERVENREQAVQAADQHAEKEGAEEGSATEGPLSQSRSSSPEEDEDTPQTSIYERLEDDEASEPLQPGLDRFSSDSFERDFDASPAGESIKSDDEVASTGHGDPLGDVFESDEATWRALAADDSVPKRHPQSSVEITGLGIVGSRISALKASAPEGVVEHLEPENEGTEPDISPPDDVAQVFSMLRSAQAAAVSSGPLASPIRLESTHDAEDARPSHSDSHRQLDEQTSAFASPFDKSHSSTTSVSTVNFDVRPPSTIDSMSPDVVARRKQRQGWTMGPVDIDSTLAAGSSQQLQAGVPDSQRASTIGLMENLDNLERALAELSPRANKPVAQESSPSIPTPIAPPPRTSSHNEPHRPVPVRPSPIDVSPTPVVETVRVPRSSSLSKAQSPPPQPAHLVALPPSPLPPSPTTLRSSEERAAPSEPEITSSAPWSALPPSPPRQPLAALADATALPPVPPKTEDAPPAASSQPVTQSPGPFRSLRKAKPWGNREGRTAKAQPSPEPGQDEFPPKSPGGSFKSTFKDFFKKSSSSHDDHSSSKSPAASPNPASPLDESGSADLAASPVPADFVPPQPAGAAFAAIAEPTDSRPSSRPASPFYNAATPDFPPGTENVVVSPGSTLSLSSTAFPAPPQLRPFGSPSGGAKLGPASSLSDYVPETPRAGFMTSDAQQSTSAPVTPHDWPNAGTRGKGNPRLSADIDRLLSQMDNIDFGIGDDEAVPAGVVVAADSTGHSPRVVEPDMTISSKATPNTVSHDVLRTTEGLLGVEGGERSRAILSADLTAIGSLMSGFNSPPMSPDQSTTAP